MRGQLIAKLTNADVCPYTVRWLHDYLFERMQFVAVGGKQSPALLVLSGVPQGLLLGPLLFLTTSMMSLVLLVP